MLSSLGWSKPFSMPKAQECSFYFGFGTAPGALALRDARTSDKDSLCRAGLSIEELEDLSNGQRNRVNPRELSNCR
jgi:hypothetical protein